MTPKELVMVGRNVTFMHLVFWGPKMKLAASLNTDTTVSSASGKPERILSQDTASRWKETWTEGLIGGLQQSSSR